MDGDSLEFVIDMWREESLDYSLFIRLSEKVRQFFALKKVLSLIYIMYVYIELIEYECNCFLFKTLLQK